MTQSIPIAVQLGPAYTGDTIHYRILNGDGTEYATWSSTNVTEVGLTGTFFVAGLVSAPDSGGYLEFSNDGSTILSTIGVIESLDANILQISGDVTAADNLELMYDGTGYSDNTAPSSRLQLTGIDTKIDSILADTGTDGVLISAAALQAIVDQWMAEDLESGKTAKQLLIDLWAVLVGNSLADDAVNPTSITYDSPDDTVQRTHAITDTTRTQS